MKPMMARILLLIVMVIFGRCGLEILLLLLLLVAELFAHYLHTCGITKKFSSKQHKANSKKLAPIDVGGEALSNFISGRHQTTLSISEISTSDNQQNHPLRNNGARDPGFVW